MPNTSFSFVTERKQKQKKGAKTSWLGGRLSDFRNHSMNSLRSNSISCRFACLANATQESKKIPKIVHPLKTSSCGMFSRIYSRKHEARSAVIGYAAYYRRDASNRLAAWLVQECFRFLAAHWLSPRYYGSPRRGKGSASHTKNFDGDDQSSESTKPLARDWRGVWGVV